MSDDRQITATIATNKGNITLRLFTEETPVTTANFINLALQKYYDNLIFHRVINDFMIQGGCPYGNGTGGPGYRFEDECKPTLRHSKPGILSMANAGPGTNGSQFFITHIATTWLDGKHTVFGEVCSDADLDIVNSIAQGDNIHSITITGDTAALLEQHKDRIETWNAQLEQAFPNR